MHRPHYHQEFALVEAAENWHNDGVVWLLQKEDGPRADCLDGEALLRASSYGNTSLVRILLSADTAPRADIRNGLALVYACNGGHVEIIRLLLESKFPPSVYGCVIEEAALPGKTDVLKILVNSQWY